MRIPVITGSLPEAYEVVDAILAYQMYKPDAIDYDIKAAFASVKNKLRTECGAIGGNAVINCQFEYKVVYEFGFGGIGETPSACLLAYGTAVLSTADYNAEIINYNDRIFQLQIDSENSVECPICGDRLQLDSEDIRLKYFGCPYCKNEIKFEAPESGNK